MTQATRTCGTCGTIVHRAGPGGPVKSWCSPDCRRQQRLEARRRRNPITTSAACVICGVTILRTGRSGPVKAACSDECRRLHRKRTRPEQITTSAPCRTCGTAIPRTGLAGAIPKYCSADCRPRCAVPACGEARRSSDWCPSHYGQWCRTGDPLTPPSRIMEKGLFCAVDGCDTPRRKRTWCAYHYAAWKRTGDPTATCYRWVERSESCEMCGSPTGPHLRRHCSKACSQAAYRARANGQETPPASISCQACGDPIDVSRRNGKAVGRRDTLACRVCIRQYRKHGSSVKALAKAHGLACGICGDDVDLSLRYPDLMRGSVDHKVPVARGGTSNWSNLQLVHLRCNFRKGARFSS